jgi:hypothetical protein
VKAGLISFHEGYKMAIPQIQNDPIYSLPHLYISGMQCSVASTTIMAIAPGACRDSTNNIDIEVGFPNLQGNTFPVVQFQNYQPALLVSSAVNGINGLDTGTIAASTQYAIFIIADSRGYNPTGGLLSLTSNAYPTLPLGYDSYRLIGFIETDGSSHFVYATHKPQNMAGSLTFYNQPATSVLSGGTATTFTAIDLTTNSAVPTTTLPNVIVWLLVVFIPAAAGDVVEFRPTGSTATSNVVTITGITAGVAQSQYVEVIAGVGSSKPEIDYLVTSSSDSVSVSVAAWTGVSNTAYPALV